MVDPDTLGLGVYGGHSPQDGGFPGADAALACQD
jgi:hypothetical protein